MAVFRCKMCGGTLKMSSDKKTGVCEFCGSEQTAPSIVSSEVASMYEKANSLRRSNDFDKANEMYAKVLAKNSGDPESYWSMVLCKYGVEYVEDPTSKKRIPTVNRTQYLSIFEDTNYKKAIQLASPKQRDIYIEEATKINEVQKGILEVSRHESPYDVFISYKETDEYGRRTRDSVYAHEIYNELTRQGLRVFFAPVSLQNILGAAYEPHIFAALNSAKVMIVIGTSKERFEAVWVKNEWSRFLKLMKEGKKKTLIPAYRDMDPYDLPPEFARLQALDMTKLGFMVDLVEGVRKLVDNSLSREVSSSGGSSASRSSSKLIQRAQIFMEDGDWTGAKDALNDILRRNPDNGEAYFYMLMAQAKVKNQDELANLRKPLSNYPAYRNAIKYGDDQTVDLLRSINSQISENMNMKSEPVVPIRRVEPRVRNTKQDAIREQERIINNIKSQMNRISGGKSKGGIVFLSILSYIIIFAWFIAFIVMLEQFVFYYSYKDTYSSKYYPMPSASIVFTVLFAIAMYIFVIIFVKKMYKLSPNSSKGFVVLAIFVPHVAIIVCSIRVMVLSKRQSVDYGQLSLEQSSKLDQLKEQLEEEENKLQALKNS